VSRYHKGKTNLDLLKQETVSGSGISWAICNSAPRSRQITMPAPHRSVFYRPDALPAANQQRQSTEGTRLYIKVNCIHNDGTWHLLKTCCTPAVTAICMNNEMNSSTLTLTLDDDRSLPLLFALVRTYTTINKAVANTINISKKAIN